MGRTGLIFLQIKIPLGKNSQSTVRYAVANRNIKAGEVIFEDKPLVSGPNQETRPICLSCDSPVGKLCASASSLFCLKYLVRQ